ncbi:MAG: hypothetical protein Q7T61_15370 [Caulobacter sp.]|nr:hypothetical protein [Caulobacter sp.]
MSFPPRFLGKPHAYLLGDGPVRRNRLRFLYLAIPGVIVGLMLAAQAFVMAADPFSQYPWSPPRDVPEEAQSPDLAPYLLNLAGRGDYDTLVVGGSTSAAFRPRDMARLLPYARHPGNFAYYGSRPKDVALVLHKVADEMPRVRHVITALDYTYMLPASEARASFPFHIYGDRPGDHFLANDMTALRLSWGLATTGAIQPGHEGYAAHETLTERVRVRGHSPRGVAQMRRAVAEARDIVAAPARLTCQDFAPLRDTLAPFARKLSAQGRTLDIVVPPYHLSFYSSVATHPSLSKIRPSIADHLVLRRCAVEAMAGLPGVRIFAFDEPWLVQDAENYSDPGHVLQAAHYRYMLKAIGAGEHQLTPQNFDAYARDLRRRVLAFQY